MLRKPPWLKIRLPSGEKFAYLQSVLRKEGLHTVCEEAVCPNKAKCWGSGTATIMILGDICTRGCKFCNVRTGNPKGEVDITEPKRVAEAVKLLKLSYVVLTSVTRDDLADGGASIFMKTIEGIKSAIPEVRVEALTPDFFGRDDLIKQVANSGLDVFAHNVEVVRRLTEDIRDQRCSYEVSISVLKKAKDFYGGKRIYTKSSLLLGLGESEDEIYQTMQDLRKADVDILVLGQYLQPSKNKVTVERYVSPDEFSNWRRIALNLGFLEVVASPLARTSYKASEVFKKICSK